MRSKSIYAIPIKTSPEGATVKVFNNKGKEIIVTQSPDTLVLKAGQGYFKRAEYLIEVSQLNCITKKETIYFTLNKRYIDNVFLSFFMPIGFLLIDPLSGAMWKPAEKEIEIVLNPVVIETD
jgi:hypothetical protein